MKDHKRAQLAFAHIEVIRVTPNPSKYRAIALKLPALVHAEGLAVALHFVAARGDAAQKLILDHLAEQVDKPDLLAWVRGLDARETALATAEVQRCLAWYKRFSQIGLPSSKEEE